MLVIMAEKYETYSEHHDRLVNSTRNQNLIVLLFRVFAFKFCVNIVYHTSCRSVDIFYVATPYIARWFVLRYNNAAALFGCLAEADFATTQPH